MASRFNRSAASSKLLYFGPKIAKTNHPYWPISACLKKAIYPPRDHPHRCCSVAPSSRLSATPRTSITAFVALDHRQRRTFRGSVVTTAMTRPRPTDNYPFLASAPPLRASCGFDGISLFHPPLIRTTQHPRALITTALFILFEGQSGQSSGSGTVNYPAGIAPAVAMARVTSQKKISIPGLRQARPFGARPAEDFSTPRPVWLCAQVRPRLHPPAHPQRRH